MWSKLRLALRRQLTVANLLENLVEVFGDREAFFLSGPLGYRRFPEEILTYRDCLLFTNLAAEALIRELDLKKGERVLLYTSGRDEYLLLALAVIKAGGIAVPLSNDLDASEVRHYAERCCAELAIVDRRVLEDRLDCSKKIPGVERWIVAGPREEVPGDFLSLDKAMDEASGFFIPYTLKPGNVVGIFHTAGKDGTLKAAMVTNRGFLGVQRVVALLLPIGPGDLGVYALPLTHVSGFAAAMTGMCAGVPACMPGSEPGRILQALQDTGASVFMGVPSTYAMMLEAGVEEYELSSVRFWFSAAGAVPQEHVEAFRRLGSLRLGPFRLPALFAETYGTVESAAMVSLRVTLPGLRLPRGCIGVPIPPTRIKVVDNKGRRIRGGDEGELLVKGPGVMPGYWNDLEETYDTLRGGWLHTGVPVKRGLFLAYFVDGDEDVDAGGARRGA